MTEVRDARPVKRQNRLLIVEDDPDVIESFKILLEMMGNDVRTAADGSAALDVARHFRPDVAFIDIDIPGINGYEVASRLRREHGSHLRLFALTGFGQPSDRERALAAGFDRHLVKPLDFASLETLLGAKRA